MMELQSSRTGLFEKPPTVKSKAGGGVRWVKEWVPQELIATGGRCLVLKWVREDALTTLKEKVAVPEAEEQESEPSTEILFLCSYDGCGRTFFDASSLRKHSHLVHHEKQYGCHYEGCGKKFSDSSKLKRHFLTHTGERDYVCPHEGCGKAFSLDFNLKSHMKTHLQENYHICRYPDCGRRFAHDYKLEAHIKAHHEKRIVVEKLHNAPKNPALSSASYDPVYSRPSDNCGREYNQEHKLKRHLKNEHPHYMEENGNPTTRLDHSKYDPGEPDDRDEDRPYRCPLKGCNKSYQYRYKLTLHFKDYPSHEVDENTPYEEIAEAVQHDTSTRRKDFVCPHEGCDKKYIHKYKLELHLKRNHLADNAVRNKKRPLMVDDDIDEDAFVGKNPKRKLKNITEKLPPTLQDARTSPPPKPNMMTKLWPVNETYEEDSEETEEDHDNAEDGWRYQEANEDDEETEDEE